MRTHRPIRLTSAISLLFAVIAMLLFAFASNATATVSPPDAVTNPDFQPACGAKVVLVLDESGSIGDAVGGVQAVRTAANAFASGLVDTGSQLAVIEFSGTAKRVFDYTAVTSGAGGTLATTFQPYFDGTAPPPADVYSIPTQLESWTNWEAALQEVNLLNAQSGTASLVVFITDGDPTAMNAPGGGIQTNVPSDTAVIPAITQANAVKTQGSHILGVGVGSAMNHVTSLNRLIQVAGPDVATSSAGLDLGTTDVLRIADFSTLPAALRGVVSQLCKATLTVTKTADRPEVATGGQVTWTVTVTNTGDVELSAVNVADAVAPGCATVIPSLAAGATTKVTCTSTLTQDTTNTATVTAFSPSQQPVGPISASASVRVTPPVVIIGAQQTTLKIDKRGPATARSGAVIAYTIKITNTGAITAQDVVMRDKVPTSMSLVRRGAGVRLVRGVIVVRVGNLAPGASKKVKIQLRIDRRASGLRTNTASASASNARTVRDGVRTRIILVGGRVVIPGVTG